MVVLLVHHSRKKDHRTFVGPIQWILIRVLLFFSAHFISFICQRINTPKLNDLVFFPILPFVTPLQCSSSSLLSGTKDTTSICLLLFVHFVPFCSVCIWSWRVLFLVSYYLSLTLSRLLPLLIRNVYFFATAVAAAIDGAAAAATVTATTVKCKSKIKSLILFLVVCVFLSFLFIWDVLSAAAVKLVSKCDEKSMNTPTTNEWLKKERARALSLSHSQIDIHVLKMLTFALGTHTHNHTYKRISTHTKIYTLYSVEALALRTL